VLEPLGVDGAGRGPRPPPETSFLRLGRAWPGFEDYTPRGLGGMPASARHSPGRAGPSSRILMLMDEPFGAADAPEPAPNSCRARGCGGGFWAAKERPHDPLRPPHAIDEAYTPPPVAIGHHAWNFISPRDPRGFRAGRSPNEGGPPPSIRGKLIGRTTSTQMIMEEVERASGQQPPSEPFVTVRARLAPDHPPRIRPAAAISIFFSASSAEPRGPTRSRLNWGGGEG